MELIEGHEGECLLLKMLTLIATCVFSDVLRRLTFRPGPLIHNIDIATKYYRLSFWKMSFAKIRCSANASELMPVVALPPALQRNNVSVTRLFVAVPYAFN